MLWKMFAVHDGGAKFFMPPFCVRHEAEAIRAVVQDAMRPDSQLAKHGQEFFLFGVGTFDDSTGVMESYPALNSYGPVGSLVDAQRKLESHSLSSVNES